MSAYYNAMGSSGGNVPVSVPAELVKISPDVSFNRPVGHIVFDTNTRSLYQVVNEVATPQGVQTTWQLIANTVVSPLMQVLSGSDVLTAGVLTVANTQILASDIILISRIDPNASTAIGVGFSYSINAGVDFTITSLDVTAATETNDVSTIAYIIIRP